MGLVEASFNLLRVPKWKVETAVLGGSTNVLSLIIKRNHLMVFKFIQIDFYKNLKKVFTPLIAS